MSRSHSLAYERGQRAEEVASWYFRLNGFLSIPGFILHPDRTQRYPQTEADLIAVRFPYSAEIIGGRSMDDDNIVIQLDSDSKRIVFVLVEVKVDLCRINGPWSERSRGNMQRVIRRLGFVQEGEIDNIAADMYDNLRWENQTFVLQYIAVGSRRNESLQERHPKLVQITFDEMSDFFLKRFQDFPEKLPTGPIHIQWPNFGRYYGEAMRSNLHSKDSRRIVGEYIGL